MQVRHTCISADKNRYSLDREYKNAGWYHNKLCGRIFKPLQ